MGPNFYKKSLNMGPIFWQSPNGFLPKITKFVKNGPIFHEKSLTVGKLFWQNDL